VGYNVSNPEELMIEWTEGVAYQVLETFDSNCTRDSNTALACPLTLDVLVLVLVLVVVYLLAIDLRLRYC
jgi:hypothetical protein